MQGKDEKSCGEEWKINQARGDRLGLCVQTSSHATAVSSLYPFIDVRHYQHPMITWLSSYIKMSCSESDQQSNIIAVTL
jgi:hypothetical protein